MKEINACKCGNPFPGIYTEQFCGMTFYKVKCNRCGAESTPGIDPDPCIEEWNAENKGRDEIK